MANHQNYEQRGHHSHSQGYSSVEADRLTSLPSQQIGITSTCRRAKWNHQTRSFLIRLLKDHDVPGFRTHNAWSKDAWTSIASQFNNSGFGWDSERMMVDAPESVWATFAARKNSKDPLQWQDKSFPYYDELSALYDGRYAEGRTPRGMDYYASKAHDAFISIDESNGVYHSPSPNLQGPGEPGLDSFAQKDTEDINLDFA